MGIGRRKCWRPVVASGGDPSLPSAGELFATVTTGSTAICDSDNSSYRLSALAANNAFVANNAECYTPRLVSEEGTEAAAATGVVMRRKCRVIKPDFFADRPFMYGIFRGEEPIFIGQYC
ncbi:hypothetical protein Y032_0026g1325 [Ancylostoma ceylanicum]|uniref:Serpin domain-containing protein n=1 Tax=Ancylostoma ceylanicum TaxID=53326 RepID=A0A016UU52_9BILA|nr:hypothetical protein Y032_0026g1325 [Ancylostoma ceylanicum]